MPENAKYITQDYGQATWLVFNGKILLGTVEYPDNTRKSFVFMDDPHIPELNKEWLAPKDDESAICKSFFKAHTIVKKALKESVSV